MSDDRKVWIVAVGRSDGQVSVKGVFSSLDMAASSVWDNAVLHSVDIGADFERVKEAIAENDAWQSKYRHGWCVSIFPIQMNVWNVY